MKIGWGWKIALLYSGFVAIIVTLVVASSRQSIDLVSSDYYKDEIAYQDVLDAGKNLAALTGQVSIHAGSNDVVIEMPAELKDKMLSGDVRFYSPVNKDWDKTYKVNGNGSNMVISRAELKNTNYVVKVNLKSEGKGYYQESELQLHN
jgi:hypothetical protein